MEASLTLLYQKINNCNVFFFFKEVSFPKLFIISPFYLTKPVNYETNFYFFIFTNFAVSIDQC